MEFNFLMPVKFIFGENKLQELKELIGTKKAIIVTDATMEKIGTVDRLKEHLQVEPVVYAGVEPNPSCKSVNEATQLGREANVEFVIGLGGGSSLDAAKAVSAMISNEGSIEEYFYGEKNFVNNRVGLFLMPTTSGTGSEVTSVSVLTDKVKNVKKPVVTPMFFADSAIVDPSLTYTMPPKITAITGFDAFCHAIEAYWAVSALPICDAIGMYAIDLVVKNLRAAFDVGMNKEAREKMSEASLMAGIAFSQTRTTAIHGVSYPLCTYGNFDHGSACAATMVSFMRFNYQEETKEKLDRLVEYCGFKSMTEFADFMQELMEYTGVSRKLRDAGIKEEQLEQIAEEGAAHGLTAVNPVKVTKDDVLTILKELY